MSREQFEAWWEINYHNGNHPRFGWAAWRDGDGYKIDDDESELDGMWNAWQAATNAMEAKCASLAAENAAMKSALKFAEPWIPSSDEELNHRIEIATQTPATDAFLAKVREEAKSEAIPDGYVLVPQEMHLPADSMEGICFHCGDGDHRFGEFTDGILFVGEVDYGDGKKVYGLHIATAEYPEEGCETICEFAPQFRKGAAS